MSKDDDSVSANTMLGAGLGLGAYATATTVVAGFTCPICVVAAPALIGAGLYKKIKNRKKK